MASTATSSYVGFVSDVGDIARFFWLREANATVHDFVVSEIVMGSVWLATPLFSWMFTSAPTFMTSAHRGIDVANVGVLVASVVVTIASAADSTPVSVVVASCVALE